MTKYAMPYEQTIDGTTYHGLFYLGTCAPAVTA